MRAIRLIFGAVLALGCPSQQAGTPEPAAPEEPSPETPQPVPAPAPETPEPEPTAAPETPKGACAVGGCSGTLCLEESQAGNIATTCEFKAHYACYRTAHCERQSGGQCGWTQTPELAACLKNPPPVQ